MKWRLVLAMILATILCGCSSRGEGITINGDGLHVGTTLAKRDQLAQEKADAEIAQVRERTRLERERTEAAIEQDEKMGEVARPAMLALGIAAALSLLAVGVGYAGQRAAPALETALEVRKARRLEVILEIGPSGYSGHLTAEGYSQEALANLLRANPALDAPRLQQLQTRIGHRAMRALADNGELEETLALVDTEVEAAAN